MSKIQVIDQDLIFLSYDEPNAEKNYADLLTKVPWAKRVHGVKGSDSAHKACAALSETEYFVTVDADNIIDPSFLKVVIDLDELGLTSEHVFSYTNASPFQAWRAGFREGVKMCLDQGAKVDDLEKIWWQNYHRLLIWCNVGSDVENGLWSIYGAREGLYRTQCTDWDYSQVRDFDWLTEEWDKTYSKIEKDMLPFEIDGLGHTLRRECKLPVSMLDESASKFFKIVYNNSPRQRIKYV